MLNFIEMKFGSFRKFCARVSEGNIKMIAKVWFIATLEVIELADRLGRKYFIHTPNYV